MSNVLQIKHYAVIKQDVYEWEYELYGENTYVFLGAVVVDGLPAKDDKGIFQERIHFPIIKMISNNFKTETIIDCEVNIPPLKQGDEFYNPITGLTNTVESCLRGLDGKYYYKVNKRVDEPIGSKEKLEELKKEQEKLIEGYLEKQNGQEKYESSKFDFKSLKEENNKKWKLF